MSPKEIILQRAGADDITSILKMLKKACEEDNPKYPPMMDKSALHWIVNVVCSGYVCNATLNGRLIGSAGFSVKSYPWNIIKSHMSLEWLYITKPFRDMPDIKENLMRKVKSIAKNSKIDLNIDGYGYATNAITNY